MFPAVTVVPLGVAAMEKSAKNNVKATDAVCALLVPVTVKFKGFAEVADSPVTVRTVDDPADIEVVPKLHVTPLLQLSRIEFCRRVLGPVAEIVNCACWLPTRSTLERLLEERENTEVPVPASASPVDPFTALESTVTLPDSLPDPVGLKFTETVQLCPTFKVAGTVGKLGPQLLVSPKLALEARMLVMVTA